MRRTVLPSLPILLAILAGVFCWLIIGDLAAVGRRGYYPGDWVSFTKLRYIRSVAIGFNNIYFGTTRGILRYDAVARRWLEPLTKSDGLPDQNIRRLAVDADDSRLWVETPSGIFLYESVFEEWYKTEEFPDSLCREDINRIGSFQSYMPPFGFHILPPLTLQDANLRSYAIVSAVESTAGDVWLGTWGMGIGCIEKYSLDLELFEYGLYSDDCRVIYKHGETFYFGGRNDVGDEHAVTWWDRSQSEWGYLEARYSNDFISDQVNAMEGLGRTLFLGTDFGLVRLDSTGVFRSYSAPAYFSTNLVLSLRHYRGMLYIGTERGLYQMDLAKDSIVYLGGTLVGNSAVFDVEPYHGDLWLGSENGVVRLDLEVGRFYRYASAGGVLLGRTLDIEKDPAGGLWFATADALVWMDDRFNEKERFYVESDLGGFAPNRILITERYLWIGSDNGLYRYNRAKHFWKHYTEADGLIDNRVYNLLLDGDYLWVATAGGATRFYWNNPARGEDL